MSNKQISKIYHLIFLTTFITHQVLSQEKITGCSESPQIPSPDPSSPFSISFQTSCTNLETCIKSLQKTSTCLETFNTEMLAECEEIPKLRFVKRSICKNLSEKNFSLVEEELESPENIQISEDFKTAVIFNTELGGIFDSVGVFVNGPLTIDGDLLKSDLSDFSVDFIRRSDGKYFLRSSSTKKCFNGEAVSADCDFEEANQVFEAYFAFGYLQLKNSDGEFMRLGMGPVTFEEGVDSSNTFIAFFDNNRDLDVTIEEYCGDEKRGLVGDCPT